MQHEGHRRLADYEVHELLRRYKVEQQQSIRDRIILQYANLVESVARRFSGAAEPTEDLVQEGYIGLITAVEGFNADKGVKFSTYATHFIIGQIKHCLRDRGKIIKEPAWLQELNQKVSKVIESLSQELGRMPTNAEIASMVGMTEESVQELLTTREVFKVASLDGGGEQEEEGPSYNMDRVKTDRKVEFQLPIEEKVVLETALKKLKDLEHKVIREFYFKDRNQTEIARSLGISCNYVSHILRNSTKKLKKIMVTDELKEAQMEVQLLRKRMEEQSAQALDLTIVDPQTRLYNRRYFDNRLEEELSRASRHGHPVSFVLVRLEGYEHVSRAYGTIKAEESIRDAAALIRGSIRRVDILTRYDDRSFGLMLPHTGGQVTVVTARLGEKLETWLKEVGLAGGRAPIVPWIGYAWYPQDGAEVSRLTECVEQSMQPVGTDSRISMAA
jgi:RNA polymerase sigma-B factor